MVVENPVIPFFQWLLPNEQFSLLHPFRGGQGALLGYLFVLICLSLLGLLIAYLRGAVRHGPRGGAILVWQGVRGGVGQLFELSPRRVWALTRLAMREAMRRRIWVVFVAFVVLFLFAGWYLNPGAEQPGRLYLGFVLTSTTYLMLLLALLLSVFSLPSDINNRTITTVVTKPVRPMEIVVGRILGFGLISTGLLVLMGVTSYFFVVRGLSHHHEILQGEIPGPDALAQTVDPENVLGMTTENAGHWHRVVREPDGTIRTEPAASHWHPVRYLEKEGRYEVGPHRGMLLARVPNYGSLRFLDRSGRPAAKGINVGKEWEYYSYVEGGTLGAAIWTFDGVHPRVFRTHPDTLPLEMNVRVFRTHKGKITQGIRGTIVLRNPDPSKQIQSEPIPFVSREYASDQKLIPREIRGRIGNSPPQKLDLFTHLAENGRIEVVIQCSDSGQFLGFAPPSVYLRVDDRPFATNLLKGFLSIWAQMMLVIGYGVMFSTFLSAPIALLGTVASVVLGFFPWFVGQVASGEAEGGGPIESMIRVIRQMNQVSELEAGWATPVIQYIDQGILGVIRAALRVLPDFTRFDVTRYIAEGYNIPPALTAEQIVMTFGYLLALSIAGFFLLRSRELSA